MLKLFKRRKSRDNDNENKFENSNILKRHSLRSTTSFCESLLESDEDASEHNSVSGMSLCSTNFSPSICGGLSHDEDFFHYHSRLSMTLPSIVNDTNCLSYFVQYLETKHCLQLIKFYLDTDNFKTAALAQLNKAQECCRVQRTNSTQICPEDDNQIKNEKSNESNVPVPELRTFCDLSMDKPLTDDEKRQICEETNHKLTNCLASNECLHHETDAISAASIRDAIAIYQKYLIANAKEFISLPIDILSEISLKVCQNTEQESDGQSVNPNQNANSLSPYCFENAQKYVLAELESNYLIDFLQSTFYCKYCIELIENCSVDSKLTIYDILFSEVTLFFFMEYLEQHDERNCLDFWSSAINYRRGYANEKSMVSETAIQSDAMIIYEKFFSLQADYRLWMSDKLRSHVEERICATGQVFTCFDLPLQITAKYLEKKYFNEFLKSQLFENYVSELKMKMHEETNVGILSNVNDAPGGMKSSRNSLRRSTKLSKKNRHRKTMSDCSLDTMDERYKHISHQNTLLAMDSSSLPFKHLRDSNTNLSIDSRQLTNPNLLWYRSNSTPGGGLKFGHINAFGRYERDFDAVDGLTGTNGSAHTSKTNNWSLTAGGNKLKNAMRKLVNLPEKEVQEEIAWQVAEMIIKDVTNITLNGPQLNIGNGLNK